MDEIENLTAILESKITLSEIRNEDYRSTCWPDQVGVLISRHEAESILKLIKKQEKKMQIKTTLQDAVERCHKEGGRFWAKDRSSIKYSVELKGGGDVLRQDTLEPFFLQSVFFEETWIYEHPLKTEFQRFHEDNPGDLDLNLDTDKLVEIIGKRYWNGALEAVLGCREIMLTDLNIREIKQLFADDSE